MNKDRILFPIRRENSHIIYSRLVISYYPYFRYYSYYLYFPVVHHALVEGNTTFEYAKMP